LRPSALHMDIYNTENVVTKDTENYWNKICS